MNCRLIYLMTMNESGIYKVIASSILSLFLLSCNPEYPSSSAITVDMEAMIMPVDSDLYGITIEEINHSVDGGLYAEMIQNRSFEDGVPPLNCPYNVRTNMLITPNGFQIPFMRPDSVPGWKPLSVFSRIYSDMTMPINEYNKRSLCVSAAVDSISKSAGVVATGYSGLSVRKGKEYDLSFYARSALMAGRNIKVYLQDSVNNILSDVYTFNPSLEWKKRKHTFTASADNDGASLVFRTDSSQIFWLDVVSLFPKETWKGRHNGQRADIMEAISYLKPHFVRFPGGAFVEGYTAGTYPVWSETVGPIENRRHFWSVWEYGTTNGMGFHEYLQMCEDLGAEPIYVVNSGVTSQKRRPRYEDITQMGKMVQETLNAIAYANQPADSTYGAMRARNGHPAPFGLKYIEIGSENYGTEYTRRFRLFEAAIKEEYPEITVISNNVDEKKSRGDWSDLHFNGGSSFYLSNYHKFVPSLSLRRAGALFVGAFGYLGSSDGGTMGAALSESVFLAGIENNPGTIKRLAYSPLLGNVHYTGEYVPAISFDQSDVYLSPSYHMYSMFARNRGNYLLKSTVDTYERPIVTAGYAGAFMFDNSYDFENVRINDVPVDGCKVLSGEWTAGSGVLKAAPNKWNYVLVGDSSSYDYTFTAKIRRNKGSGMVELHVRDNGLTDENRDYIALVIGNNNKIELYHCSGNIRDSLAQEKDFVVENNKWYDVVVECREERVKCSIDGENIFDTSMHSVPSIVSVATVDTLSEELVLKVINTTWHEEKTDLNFAGFAVGDEVSVTELKALPENRNTASKPELVKPREFKYYFHPAVSRSYVFPPNSISILRIPIVDFKDLSYF